MKTNVSAPRTFEFCFPRHDTLVLVEDAGGEVLIRATRDTFTEERKLAFVHELAAEGFIPDRYLWCSTINQHDILGVRWLVDYSWLALNEAMLARTRRFVVRLLVASALAWLALMALVLLRISR